jgi:uncharacterized membrane protein
MLQEHPEYPSLLAISDVLTDLGVENMAIKGSVDEISSFSAPFIALGASETYGSNVFYVVKSIDIYNVDFYDPEKKRFRRETLENFSAIYRSVTLVGEPQSDAGEKEYELFMRREKSASIAKGLILIGIPLTAICLATINVFQVWDPWLLFPFVYCALTIIGFFLSGMLLFYEMDSKNSIFESICRIREKTNCHAILNSKGAKILGISWGIIGCGYFAALYFLILLKGFHDASVFYILYILSTLSSAYIFYSVFYQWKVARQWCPMCLGVQAILAIQLLTSFLGNFYRPLNNDPRIIENIITFGLLFFLSAIAAQSFLTAFKKANQSKLLDFQLKRLKNNKIVFEALLNDQREHNFPENDVGIIIGNPSGEVTLLKVCNPYCSACAVAQSYIKELINHNPNLRVQIIFTASVSEGDHQGPIVKHLMAIDSKNNKTLTGAALDDWYDSPNKDYHRFSLKYPLKSELEDQDAKLRAMSEWCDYYKIAVTPTFFVNGKQLPKEYNYNNLKYVLR